MPKTIAAREPDAPTMSFDVESTEGLAELGLGQKVRVVVEGVITEARAPEMREDWGVDVKPGKKRPMKQCPGRITVALEASPKITAQGDSGVEVLNEQLRSDGEEDYPA
jgi:hypothetical protein